jgi:quercetin dioxygenase-like cupin family protein
MGRRKENQMRALFTGAVVTLAPGRAISGKASAAGEIHVLAGRAWITVENQQDDYWLAAGESIRVEAGRLVVVEADRAPCRLVFPSASGRPACETGFRAIQLHNC